MGLSLTVFINSTSVFSEPGPVAGVVSKEPPGAAPAGVVVPAGQSSRTRGRRTRRSRTTQRTRRERMRR